ncbi:MAG: lipoate--protein ligase family protein [Dysgonamonadaceae bacterium]|jgi:lipoate-protein ligase A|nr:lipoate--protein ligase family protein [Dysgonamonadaceae bacterium]
MFLIKSPSTEPQYNKVLEKQLLERNNKDILLFYINKPSVIVGRNQQIEAEADIEYCRRNNIEIIRRLSGGGAVYHDFGNINYSIIVTKTKDYPLDCDFWQPVVEALQVIGVPVSVGLRRELLVDGRKISGTASIVTGNRILFHGTLLHRVNLGNLSSALQGDRSKGGRGVPSVPSEVMNLSEITGKEESTEEFLERIIRYLCGRKYRYISLESL